MLHRRLLLAVFCLSVIAIVTVEPVYACSGGAPLTIRGYLNAADYLIHARVVETDDAGPNVIVRVERYLAGGSGPEHLLIKGLDPALIAYIGAGRSSGGDCLGIYPVFPRADLFYAFIKRHQDGSYRPVQTLFNQSYFNFEAYDTQEVFLEGTPEDPDYADRGSGEEVTESEFLAIIEAQAGISPVAPDRASPYPLKAPLAIHPTYRDGFYIFPVDFGEPIYIPDMQTYIRSHPLYFRVWSGPMCETEDCIQLAPNNLDFSMQIDNTIYLAPSEEIDGQASLFSPTSDAIAVWNSCELTIYTTGHPRLGQEWYEVEPVASVSLTTIDACERFHKAAAWTPDGRFLAYADQQGLWLWDVYGIDLPPQLVIPADPGVMVTPRYFSPAGRYLAVQAGDDRFTLDVRSGETYPDGYVSPDDRLLLSVDTSLASSTVQLCPLTPYRCWDVSGMYVSRWNEDEDELEYFEDTNQVFQLAWTSTGTFLALVCGVDNPDLCAIFSHHTDDTITAFLRDYGRQFAFEPATDQLAVVADDTTISIDGEIIEFTGQIIGEIEAIRWLPPLFYYE